MSVNIDCRNTLCSLRNVRVSGLQRKGYMHTCTSREKWVILGDLVKERNFDRNQQVWMQLVDHLSDRIYRI